MNKRQIKRTKKALAHGLTIKLSTELVNNKK